MSEVLLCDVCGKPIAPEEFVALVRLGPNRYVVAQTGLQVGDMIDYDVYAHGACIAEKGEPIGTFQMGHG